jgi:hypothetical protein
MISRREAAIITAYTGITLGDFDAFFEYASEKTGRSFGSGEMASKMWWERLHELSRTDFLALEIEQKREKPPFPGGK